MDSIRGTRDALSVRRVFGDPYEHNGVTVIPVARVAGGAGGGGGEGVDEERKGNGFGTGFGLRAHPVGMYEISNGKVDRARRNSPGVLGGFQRSSLRGPVSEGTKSACGVCQPRVLRGRRLSSSATRARSALEAVNVHVDEAEFVVILGAVRLWQDDAPQRHRGPRHSIGRLHPDQRTRHLRCVARRTIRYPTSRRSSGREKVDQGALARFKRVTARAIALPAGPRDECGRYCSRPPEVGAGEKRALPIDAVGLSSAVRHRLPVLHAAHNAQ